MRLYLIDDCPVERECGDHWLRGETDWTFRLCEDFHPAINVLVCSGWETPEYVQLAESLGAGFIPKTLDFKTRIEVIRGLYDKR